jgi:hypothetical protein
MPQTRLVNAKVALILWALVAFLYFYLSYDYIQVTMHDKQFLEYQQYVVQLAGAEERPAKEIKELLLVKAEQLKLPLRTDQIVVKGGGQSLNVIVNYDVDVEVPWIQRQIYTKNFEHDVRFQSPR